MTFGTLKVKVIRGKTEMISYEIDNINHDIITLTKTNIKGMGLEKIGKYLFSEVRTHEKRKYTFSKKLI